jgi:hypothetical protein
MGCQYSIEQVDESKRYEENGTISPAREKKQLSDLSSQNLQPINSKESESSKNVGMIQVIKKTSSKKNIVGSVKGDIFVPSPVMSPRSEQGSSIQTDSKTPNLTMAMQETRLFRPCEIYLKNHSPMQDRYGQDVQKVAYHQPKSTTTIFIPRYFHIQPLNPQLENYIDVDEIEGKI